MTEHEHASAADAAAFARHVELLERISLVAAHIDAARQEMLTLIRELDDS